MAESYLHAICNRYNKIKIAKDYEKQNYLRR
jgi:hypothetical protein